MKRLSILLLILISVVGCAYRRAKPDKDAVDPSFRILCTEKADAVRLGLRFQLGLDKEGIKCFRGYRKVDIDDEAGIPVLVSDERKEVKVIGHVWCSGRVHSYLCADDQKCLVPFMIKNGFGFTDYRSQEKLEKTYDLNLKEYSYDQFHDYILTLGSRKNPLLFDSWWP